MKKKLYQILIIALMVLPCAFGLVACKDKGANNTKSIEVCLKEDTYSMVDNVITVTYGCKVSLSSEDFIVSVSNNGEKEIVNLAKDGQIGFNYESNLPDDGITPAGSYKITFSYENLDDVCVTVVVEKANIDMSNVSWNYDDSFTYDGEEKQVYLENLPQGVSVEYEGENKATDAGKYTVTAVLTYEDESNYNKLEPMSITWKIKKAIINIGDVSLSDYFYDGEEKSAKLSSLFEIPENIIVDKIIGDVTATDVGEYDVEITFKYIGEKENNYTISPVMARWNITPGIYIVNESSIVLKENYNYYYTGEELSVMIDTENLDSNVRVLSVYGNKGINAQKYTISIEFEYIGSDNNYDSVKDVALIDAWEIKKAPLTVTAFDKTISFGENASNNSYKVEGLVNGETEAVLTGEIEYKYYIKGTETEYVAGNDIGEYDIVISGFESNNYEIVYQKGVLTVEPIQIDAEKFTWTQPDMIYTGLPIAPTLNNVPQGIDVSYKYMNAGQESESINVGNYVACATIITDSKNYNMLGNLTDFAYEIKRATIGSFDEVSLKVSELTYNGSEQTIAEELDDFNGVPAGAKISSITGNWAKNVSLSYTLEVTFTQDDSGNYNDVTFTKQFTWKISPKELTITINSYVILYGEEAPQAEYTISGLAVNDTEDVIKGTPIYTYDGYAVGSLAGVYTINIGDSDLHAENYSITVIPGTLTVETIKIEISQLEWGNVSDFVFDGEVKKPELTSVPDNVIATYLYTKDGNEVTPINAGTYTVKVILEPVSPRYELVGEFINELEYSIAKADFDISNVTWDYEEAFTYDGEEKSVHLLNLPENINVEYGGTVSATNAKIYRAEATLTHEDSENYNQQKLTLSWRINKSIITLNVVLKNYNYDGTEKFAGISYGLPENVEVDEWEGTTSATEAGVYDVIISFKYVGENKSNYTLRDVSTTWSINTVPFVEPSSAVTLIGEYDYTYTGQIFSVEVDTSNLSSNVSIKSISGIQGVMAKKYTIIIELNYIGSSTNYNSAASIILTDAWEIKKALLTVIANDNVISYNEEASGNGYVVTGLVGGDIEEAVIEGEAKYTFGEYEVGSPVGNYHIYVEGLYAENYTLMCVPGDLIVEKAKVDASKFTWGDFDNTYTGEPIRPTLTNVPDYVQVTGYKYTLNEEVVVPIEPNEYVVEAYLRVTNDNYEIFNKASLTYTITTNQEVVVGNFVVKTDSDSTYYDVASYIGQETEVVVPAKVNGISVRYILDNAFNAENRISNANITQVTIEEGIVKIGSSAFKGCEGLKILTIPASVNNVGARAFEDSGIEKIIIKDAAVIEFEDSALVGANQLKVLSLLGSSEALVNGSMGDLTGGLSELEIYQAVTLGENAFGSYENIKTMSVYNDVSFNVASDAFENLGVTTLNIYYADYLEEGTGKENLTKEFMYKFSGLTQLTKINVDLNITKIMPQAFSEFGNLSRLSIGDGAYIDVSSIPSNLSSRQLKIDLVVLDDDIVEGLTLNITHDSGDSTLDTLTADFLNKFDAENVITISLSANFTAIGEDAFLFYMNLSKLDFTEDSKITYIDESAFGEGDALFYLNVYGPTSNDSVVYQMFNTEEGEFNYRLQYNDSYDLGA